MFDIKLFRCTLTGLLFLRECQGGLKSCLPCVPMCRVRMLVAADALAPEGGQIIDRLSKFCKFTRLRAHRSDKYILRGHIISSQMSVISRYRFLVSSVEI